MKILTDETANRIQRNIVAPALRGEYHLAIAGIPPALDDLYRAIPDGKRISYGTVYTVKVLSEHLHAQFVRLGAPVCEIAAAVFETSDDWRGKGVGLDMLSFCGLEDYEKVLPFFDAAAVSDDWEVREFAQMSFKKLIKKYPGEMKEYLLHRAGASDPNMRRFVGETLRPVGENSWFYRDPDYPLCILRLMFRERSAYPRTSVGNNLSDLARRLPDLVYGLVAELVDSGDKNSYWIAYRACRNLVKKEPVRVMDLLKVDEYRYKERVHRRHEH